MAHPYHLKEKAIKLRRRGCSLKEISEAVGVVKSTVSIWVGDVELNIEAKDRLFRHTKYRYFINAQHRREQTKALEQRYFDEATKEMKVKPNANKLICAMIYWCEGGKNAHDGIRFTNSDPDLVKKFLELIRLSFAIDESKFRVCVHLHHYHDKNKQLDFWSKITDIDKRQFIKPYQKPNTGKRTRDGYQGCVSVYYYSSDLARRLMAVARAFLNKK